MSAPVENLLPRVQARAVENEKPEASARSTANNLQVRTLIALPLAAAVAAGVHAWVASRQLLAERHYFPLLAIVFVSGVVLAVSQRFSPTIRRWMQNTGPIIAAAVYALTLWELITSGFHWLPLPYFPSPGTVLENILEDRERLFECTWDSLVRLLAGYLLGVVVALVTGVCIGWYQKARYWGMPLLKVIGPIPATAWIPLAMVLTPNPKWTPIGLVALSVWFPVTMLTMSGISNTRASYLDVARTLGASQRYLIFRVAIPAAMPNIFIGLFMGLGASFLTLIVAETVGVKSGLGWYVQWAQGWAEYGKVYGALIIMAAFFSTIMTALFKVRDRVLAWQKGMIKW
jgi:NitT/TauT family transport system permease protein